MDTFIFKSADYNSEAQIITLGYAYNGGPSFSEIVHFPGAKKNLSNAETEALHATMRGLHLAAGISYYKAYCPKNIQIEDYDLTKEEADFFFKFYRHGLGEFSIENNRDLRGIIRFPVQSNHHLKPSNIQLVNKCVVPVGGGKDSIVSIEALRQAGQSFRMIAINAGKPILDVMEIASCGKPQDAIHIKRQLDPKLFELNDAGAMNGHVPITGILSFIMACGAVLYGYDSVVMSNEGSANEGNMQFGGIEVNHQYSKSLDFELDFENFIQKTALENFKYFSLLRPLNETGIAALFSKQKKYFDAFKSCNRNFHLDKGLQKFGWCCSCPKCQFVFLVLSLFIKREKLILIFGKNLLNDETQEDGFRELCGLKGHKPFECVGEVEECQQIITSLSLTDWADDMLVQKLSSELNIEVIKPKILNERALLFKYEHNIPKEFLEYLNAFIRS
ncbi:MAG: endonuclease domain-containing protein [Kordiimonadaceae bacterium]|nr:endonuclease domain-containing protein [Kordiimonadaceae bacterium]